MAPVLPRVSILLSVSLLFFLSGCSHDDNGTNPPGDVTPPARIGDLAIVNPTGQRVALTWTAPGDDGTEGRASRYEIRYALSPLTDQAWDSATAVEEPPVPTLPGKGEYLYLAGLADGTWYFGVKAADDEYNLSPMSNVVSARFGDITPPAPVLDLAVSSITNHSATLRWKAPGDDGGAGTAAAYDIRYAQTAITEETWDTAARAPGMITPAPAGSIESYGIEGLEMGRTYYFALKTADEHPNWSLLSNVASGTATDVDPPGRITGLTATSGTGESITLAWTAPGDDGETGRAEEYDLRYSTEVLYDVIWDAAVRVAGVPPPDTAGTPQSFTVTGLESGRKYYFGIKTRDEIPNWSVLSVVATATATPFSYRRLTSNPGIDFYVERPAWSPDGSEIAFTVDWDGNAEIYRMPSGGGTPIRLTSDGGRDQCPAWSPDGGRISFSSNRGGGRMELWTMNASDGSDPRLLTRQGDDIGPASWSPDGNRIAYQLGIPMVTIQSTKICIIPSAGGASVILVDGDYVNMDPSWSPDGTRIAYTSARNDYIPRIWLVPIAGGIPTQVSIGNRGDLKPSWSPDGNRIAFFSYSSGNMEIWTMSPSGQDLVQITADPSYDYDPAWSPDGRQIAFVSGRSGRAEIWIYEMQVP